MEMEDQEESDDSDDDLYGTSHEDSQATKLDQ